MSLFSERHYIWRAGRAGGGRGTKATGHLVLLLVRVLHVVTWYCWCVCCMWSPGATGACGHLWSSQARDVVVYIGNICQDRTPFALIPQRYLVGTLVKTSGRLPRCGVCGDLWSMQAHDVVFHIEDICRWKKGPVSGSLFSFEYLEGSCQVK